MRIRPVKLHWSLTRIIRTYTIIYILYCSTKPLIFFQPRLNVEVQVNFSPQFYVHINAKVFIHAFMHLCLEFDYGSYVEEKQVSQILFYTSCGTLIRVRIIPVKLDRILTGIIRTYIITYILYCSTKPLVFFQSRLNGKVQVYFSPQFYVHIKAKLFMQAFMHLCLVRLGLSSREEKRLSQKVFNNSCGTLIWVGIIAVKVDRSLILIIRTYITVYILYCSTKTFCFFLNLV